MQISRQSGSARAIVILTLAGVAVGVIGGRRFIQPANGRAASEASHTALLAAVAVNPQETASATGPATAPAQVTFDDRKDGIRLQYSSQWARKADDDCTLHLVPAKERSDREITFDVPDLPPHFPGMIKLSLIEDGYVGDLKKQHPGARVDRSQAHAMPRGVKARLVELSWNNHDKAYRNVGLLMMRGEHVFILGAQAQAPDLPATRSDFDSIAASLQWTK